MDYTGEILSLICAILWGVAVIFFKKSGDIIKPSRLNFVKNIIALLLFIISLIILGIDFIPEYDFWTYLILAISGIFGITLADTLFFMCLNKIGAVLNSVVDCIYSPFVIILAFLFFGEAVCLTTILGGVVIISAIILGSIEKGSLKISKNEMLAGIFYGILSMLFMAIAIIIIKYPVFGHPAVLGSVDVVWLITARIFFAIIAFFIFIFPFSKDKIGYFKSFIPIRGWWKYVFPGTFIGTYLSMLIWLIGWEKIANASIAAILNQTSIIFVMIFAFIFLKEVLSVRKVIAIILAFFGVALVMIR